MLHYATTTTPIITTVQFCLFDYIDYIHSDRRVVVVVADLGTDLNVKELFTKFVRFRFAASTICSLLLVDALSTTVGDLCDLSFWTTWRREHAAWTGSKDCYRTLNDWQEGASSEVNIVDMDPNAFDHFLTDVHTGTDCP